jgi:hypothetical protein
MATRQVQHARRVAAVADDFNFTRFVFFNILLKLNKLTNSLFGIVFGVKGKHHCAMNLEHVA